MFLVWRRDAEKAQNEMSGRSCSQSDTDSDVEDERTTTQRRRWSSESTKGRDHPLALPETGTALPTT